MVIFPQRTFTSLVHAHAGRTQGAAVGQFFCCAPKLPLRAGLCVNIMNAINVIQPYKHLTMWVFDDAKVGLIQEPFVSGADEIIEKMVANIPDAENGFILLFSSRPFPGHQAVFEWRREEQGGNWYYFKELDMEGWLCPALFNYFESAPQYLYVQFKERS